MSATFPNSSAWFWLAAGVLAGVAISFALGELWRYSGHRYGRTRVAIIGVASTIAITAVTVLIYLQLGRPDLVADIPALRAPHATNPPSDDAQPRSMEAVTEQLAARLAREGGGDPDWDLLAQSYDFMGRVEDAARAREHVAIAASQSVAPPMAGPSAALEQAQALRLQRKFAEARAAYETAIARGEMSADSWADYADVLASESQNKLSGAPAQAIDKALALDPNHKKALWLKASLAHEQHRYTDAIPIWRRLRAVMGDNESDVRIIDANLAEAQELAGAATAQSPSQSSTSISGSIEIDSKLLARATAGSALFIYAKSVDSPGPPLAVLRIPVAKWPVSFTLDDSMAMLPGRNLSSAKDVVVEARVSKSGQATATSGDLQSTGARVNPHDGKVVRLRIDKEVT